LWQFVELYSIIVHGDYHISGILLGILTVAIQLADVEECFHLDRIIYVTAAHTIVSWLFFL